MKTKTKKVSEGTKKKPFGKPLTQENSHAEVESKEKKNNTKDHVGENAK